MFSFTFVQVVLFVISLVVSFFAAVMLTVRESFNVSWFESFKNAGVAALSWPLFFIVVFFAARFWLRVIGFAFGLSDF